MKRIFAISVPKWGIEMQEGTFVAWRVAEGVEVAKGDEIADIETDKIVNTLEAAADGVLARCIATEGQTLAVGSLLGVLAAEDVGDEEIDAFIASFGQDAAAGDDTRPAATAEAAKPSVGKPVRAALAARKLAEKLGVDLATVTGTGRNGRITPEDVRRAAEAVPSAGAGTDDAAYSAQPLSATRKTIARRLTASKQEIPHYYLSADIVMDACLARRAELNESGSDITLNDLVAQAAIQALNDVPELNAHLVDDELRQFGQVNLAVAVATDRGLVTPVVHGADLKSLEELAAAIRTLAGTALEGGLERGDVEGGTFTVSNLGMHGVRQFTAIINPPQVGILAVGAVRSGVTMVDGAAVESRRMTVTLSCDHRAVDGVLGARFLQALKRHLESGRPKLS